MTPPWEWIGAERPALRKVIAHAALGNDVLRACRLVLDLFAQTADGNIHRTQVAVVVIAPDVLHQFLAREHTAGRGRQKAEDIEFAGGKLECAPVLVDHAARTGDAQAVPSLRLRLFALLARKRAAHVRLDARHQLAHGERLCDIVVRAQLEAHDLVGLLLSRGQHDDRNVALRTHAAADLEAVHLGQHDVEQNEVGRLGERLVQTFRAVIGRHGIVALAAEVEHQDIRDRLFVLDNEDFFLIHTFPP